MDTTYYIVAGVDYNRETCAGEIRVDDLSEDLEF